MQPRICMCCGEAIAEGGNKLSRNPNICASCSSMADGAGDTPCGELERLRDDLGGSRAPQSREPAREPDPDEKVLEWQAKPEPAHTK